MKKYGYAKCAMCKDSFKKSGARNWYCLPCSEIAKKEHDEKHNAKMKDFTIAPYGDKKTWRNKVTLHYTQVLRRNKNKKLKKNK